MLPEPSCRRCGDTGKVGYRTLGEVEPRDMGTFTVQDMGGWGTRACECVRDLPPVDGRATWWESETLYSKVVDVPIGCECIELRVDGEVPRMADGRRAHRTGDNVYYPTLISLEPPGKVELFPEDARKLAEALIEAADICEQADGPVMAERNAG